MTGLRDPNAENSLRDPNAENSLRDPNARTGLRLAVISHTPHHRTPEGLVGWGPTVTELSHLATRFAAVVHVAPVHNGPAPANASAYTADNLEVHAVPPAGGEGVRAKVGLVATLPRYESAVRRAVRSADVVHVRAPASIAAVALFHLRATRWDGPCWVKYAGNWRPDGDEPWAYRLQRRWLRAGFGRVAVTVNGRWEGDPPHVRSFHNPSLTDEELEAGRAAAAAKPPTDPLTLAFVGRVEAAKGAVEAVEIAACLAERGHPCRLELVGEGPALDPCRGLAARLGVPATAHGWLDRAGVHAVLARSHVLVLPSRSEGWPKVLSEAMAFGAVPVAPAISAIPQTFADTGAGVLTDGTDSEAFCRAITGLVEAPGHLDRARAAGLRAARRFTFTAYLAEVETLFRQQWGLALRSST